MRRRRRSLLGTTRPLDRRPCDTCGEPIFFAQRIPSDQWRAFTATPAGVNHRPFAYVVIGVQAWRRVDLLEHYLITRQVTEEKARELIDTYPHHLLHTHDREDEETSP